MKNKLKKLLSQLKKFLINNWYILLFLIPLIKIAIINRHPTNDSWFLLASGKYVIGHGIPYINPFTIHEGLEIVMQQWLSSIIFYGSYNLFGKYSLFFLTLLLSLINLIVFYKICYMVSKKKIISAVVTSIVFYFIAGYCVLRPQLFSNLIFLLELLCLEKFIENRNYKILFMIPILSLLLINLHASMWLLQFVFMLPFLVSFIFKGKEYKWKLIILMLVLTLGVGIINPYGFKAIIYVFESYNIPEINSFVTEMEPLALDSKLGIRLIFSLLFIMVLINYKVNKKIDVRFILFICGTGLMAFMHEKCFSYYALFTGYSVSYLLCDFKLKIKNKYFVSLLKGLIIGGCFCIICSLVYVIWLLPKNYKFEDSVPLYKSVNYVVEHYDVNDVSMFADYDYGGYIEFKGMKTYIDPRAELFVKKLNKKEDILQECVNLSNGDDSTYEKFVDKYNFSHMIIPSNLSELDEYVANSGKYVLEYTELSDIGLTFNLYVRKEISVLNNVS